MYTCTTRSFFKPRERQRKRPFPRKIAALPLLALVFMALQSWDYHPWENMMVVQPVGAWSNLSPAQRQTLQAGGTVTNFNSGICNGANPILLTISAGPAPNALDNTSINTRQPRRWGNTSFYLARQNMGSNGVQYCFDLSIPSAVSVDSREHAYFAKSENIRVSSFNGVNPVNLNAGYQGGPVGNAFVTGNGTGNVHFSANGKTGGGLWWTASSVSAVTRVCVEYYALAGELPTIEPFRLSIDGVKCLPDPPVSCSSSSPISRWGRLAANDGVWLDDGQPVYDFNTGFCDEAGAPITFIEIDADPAPATNNPFLNNKPPRPYGRYSLDNSREYLGGGGNMYCFTLDEARPIRLSSEEHKFFAGPERVRIRAWLGADQVALTGATNGPPPGNNNGLFFSGSGYGKGIYWTATSGTQPVSKVCVESWRTDGGALTGEPFSLELCATRCLFDDAYACSLASGPACNYVPQIMITKTVTPVNEYGLNTCTNASGNVELPVYKVSITMENNEGGAKELFLEDDLLNYFAAAYVDTITAPQIVASTATGPPLINPWFDGRNYTNLFIPGTGWLSAGQFLTVEFTIALNPNAPGAIAALCNTAFGGGTIGNGFVVSDLSGNLGGGYSTPTAVTNLPANYSATPAQDVTMEATLMNYMNAIQAWVNNHGGATFNVPGCGPITWTSDFDMDNWVWNCSYIDGHIDVTFTAHDNCGHTFTTCATFTLEDTQGPACVKATNFTLNCGDPDAADDLDEWLNYDGNWNDLSQPVTFTHDFTGIPPGACNGTPIKVTWTATDNCGNQTIFIGYLTVVDGQGPVFVNLPTTLNLDPCTAIPPPDNVTATDACDPNVTVSFNETSSGPACNQTIIRTWTATDDCGNSTTGSQTIYIVDNLPPVFSNVPADLTAECPNVPPVQTPTVTDCSPVNVVFGEQQTGGACPLPNIITRTWTATDACGLTTTVTQTIHMTPPFVPSTLVFTFVPPDITTTCDQNPGFGTPVAETTCPAGGLSVSFTDVVNSNGDCSQPFSITRTWIAHDACGNMVSASQTINTGPDTQGPTFASDTPDSITVDCGGPLYTPVAFDNCGATTLNYVDSGQTGTCATGFQFTRTWTATDVCGNSTTFVQQVTTNPDNTPPTFIFVPYDQFFDCDEPIVFPDPIAFDNCGDVTITFQDSIIGTGDCHEVNGVWYGYDIVRTWIATDECGNSTTATTSAWVLPGFNSGNKIAFSYVPLDKNLDCSGNAVFGDPVCHSACGALTISFWDEIIAGDCSTPTVVTRHWTATDVCGNSTIAQQTITIQPDKTAPSFAALPEDFTMTCSSGDSPVFANPVVSDNCANGASLTVTHDDDWSSPSGSTCASQSVTRTWTATDACGNAVTASQTINIVDNEAPVFSNVPATITIGCNDPVVFQNSIDVADGCSSFTLEYVDDMIPLTCSQQYMRTWAAMDACGNFSFINQVIVQTDNEAPIFTYLPDDEFVNCGEPVAFFDPVVSDECSAVNLTFVDEVANLACGEKHTRTWTATDACGNAVTTERHITITDTEAPVFTTAVADQTIECGEVVEFANMTALDDCSSAALAYSDNIQLNNCGQTTTRTWTATDGCGNAATVSQSIAEVDTQAPVFEPMPTELSMTQAEYNAWTPPVATATDCNNVTATVETLSLASCESAKHVFNYSAMDACGNTATHELTINISDAVFAASAVMPTTFDCGNSYALTASAVYGTAPYQFTWSVVEGNGWEITTGGDSETATLLAGEGTATIALEVTDAVGCADLHAFTVSCSAIASNTNEAVVAGFALAPNPVNDLLNVRYSTSISTDATLRVLNALGEVVSLRNSQTSMGVNQAQLDVAGLAAGTYFLTLQVGGELFTERFVKVW